MLINSFVRFILFYLLFLPIQLSADELIVETVATVPGIPWGMDFIDENRIIITIRSGKLGILDIKHNRFDQVKGLPKIATDGQGGLLDVAIGPHFLSDGWIYLTYSKSTNRGHVTTLARSQLKNKQLLNWQDLLVTDSASEIDTHHFGSRITFDHKGHVFFSIGDRGVREKAQNLRNHAGSIIRLTLDGKIPADNPFVNQKDKLDEIWSYGHRNPQGLVFDLDNNRLWSIEHGPRGGDEINLIGKGLNYGWPVVSHGKEYSLPIAIGEGTEKPGMESPRKVYIPSIAPGSLLYYDGTAFPEWQGNLFAGALKLQHLNRVEIDDNNQVTFEHRLLEDLSERIRALTQSPEGWIYISTDSGKIMRLRPGS